MGDPTKFSHIWEYYFFNVEFMLLLLQELFILFYTDHHNNCDRRTSKDHGTRWLLYFNFAVDIFVSVYSVSRAAPAMLRQLIFPAFVTDIGIMFIPAGIVIRICAVLTLKKAFTLYVRTSDRQRLVTSGLYNVVRHPAYSGSILSLLGVALTFRSIAAVCIVFLSCFICYNIRICIEEKAMEEQFGERYIMYKRNTCRLVPYIF